MRKVIVSNLMSLDGFFEDANRTLGWFVPDEEFFTYAREMLCAADTILFGRRTYEHMAAYWPSAPADEIAEKMNGLAKVVFSRTLNTVEWNNSKLIRGDAAAEVARMKKAPGSDMVILGSAELASSLLQAELVDEYRVIVSPVVLGAGNPLFPNIKHKLNLRLSRLQALSSGVVVLYYHRG
jgi:dihydrofolate reductase